MGLFDSIKKAFVDPVGAATGTNSLDLIPGIGDARAQDRANEANKKLNQNNNEWMERMSNTAYQRAMADMGKAGLNPILAYQQGGASVPNLTAATVSPSSKTGLANAALSAFTGISGANAATLNANTARATSESSIALQGSQTAQAVAQTEKTQAETAKTMDSIKNQKVRRQLEEAQIPLAKTKESAAALAEKGTKTINRAFDSVLKNVAKPRVDSKSLKYNNPLIPDFIENRKRK